MFPSYSHQMLSRLWAENEKKLNEYRQNIAMENRISQRIQESAAEFAAINKREQDAKKTYEKRLERLRAARPGL